MTTTTTTTCLRVISTARTTWAIWTTKISTQQMMKRSGEALPVRCRLRRLPVRPSRPSTVGVALPLDKKACPLCLTSPNRTRTSTGGSCYRCLAAYAAHSSAAPFFLPFHAPAHPASLRQLAGVRCGRNVFWFRMHVQTTKPPFFPRYANGICVLRPRKTGGVTIKRNAACCRSFTAT